MTVSNELIPDKYTGNGSVTAFAVSFRFLEDDEVDATLTDVNGDDTTQILTTNYTLTGAGNQSGGTLTMIVAPASGEKLTITRKLEIKQEIDYEENDEFPANTHETGLDRITMIAQQVNELAERSLKAPTSSGISDGELIDTEVVANYYLKLNATKTGFSAISPANASIELSLSGAFAVTDGNFVVADGTNYVVESGNTARTSLGLGTGDSPTFTALTATGTITGASGTWDSGGMDLAASDTYAISGTDVLNSTTLGTGVIASSLTSVGTLTTGTWQATTIAVNQGGTGQTSYTDGQLLIGNTTGNTLAKAALTGGTNVTVTNGSGSITLEVGLSNDIQFNDAKGIRDDSGNEVVLFQKTASAVNYFDIQNAAAGSSPKFSVAGSDVNIDFTFQPKGTGCLIVRGTSSTSACVQLREDTDNGTNYVELKAPTAIGSSGTMTVPEGTDTLVGKATTDTLTNKSGAISQWTNDSGYITATLTNEEVEDIAGPLLATGGTKVGISFTYQDGTGDMDVTVSDTTVAGDSGSTGMTPGDTLTIAGGTNITTSMSGDTLTIDGGAGSSGSWVKISDATASSDATIDFISLSGTYLKYMVVLEHVLPATDNTDLWIRTSTNNGSSYDAGASDYEFGTSSYAFGRQDTAGETVPEIRLTGTGGQAVGNAADEGVSGDVFLSDHADAADTTIIASLMNRGHSTPYAAGHRCVGRRLSAADVDAIRFLFSSGNIASGTFTLYGLLA